MFWWNSIFLMLFVIPFFITDAFPAWLYFVLFLLFMAIGNISLEKSSKPLNNREKRLYKLKRILK